MEDLAWICRKTLGKSLNKNPYIYNEWDEQKYEEYKRKKLKFGFILEDQEMKVAPAIRNAMNETIN